MNQCQNDEVKMTVVNDALKISIPTVTTSNADRILTSLAKKALAILKYDGTQPSDLAFIDFRNSSPLSQSLIDTLQRTISLFIVNNDFLSEYYEVSSSESLIPRLESFVGQDNE